jgi:hypothetical protein
MRAKLRGISRRSSNPSDLYLGAFSEWGNKYAEEGGEHRFGLKLAQLRFYANE